jgi:hypothetical protein
LEVRREIEELMAENSLPSEVLSQLKNYFNIPKTDADDSKGLTTCDGKVKILGDKLGSSRWNKNMQFKPFLHLGLAGILT